jgi:4,4'-diaponeurosporenoate glycosyltransferase
MIFNLTILILGLFASIYLFWRLQNLNNQVLLKDNSAAMTMTEDGNFIENLSVSIIIPSRNEEKTLPLILGDLKNQTLQPLEIICVNDGSSDHTRDVVLSAGGNVFLLDVSDKPADWMGKAWACQKGSEMAKGRLLLFLDADVRLAPEGLAKLISTYISSNCTISVQPYHKVSKAYEQLSMFFNVILIGANGAGLPVKNSNAGLYGPVILISQEDYNDIGGHRAAKKTITDDLALGDALTRAGKKYRLFLGGGDISFRMYEEGVKALFHGWTKNFATGAGKTPFRLRVLMFGWVTSSTAALLYMLQALWAGETVWALVYLLFYGIWVAELNRIVPKVGNFSWLARLFYPIFMIVFLTIFFWSVWKKLFHRQVTWKGRTMKPEA